MSVAAHILKTTFNGGLMSPRMDGRTDSEKYATGCQILDNFIPWPQGGISKRPGTQYLDNLRGNGSKFAILLPFRRSAEENYVLIMDEDGISIWDATNDTKFAPIASTWTASTSYLVGDFVKNGSNYYYCTQSHTSAGSFNLGFFVQTAGANDYFMPFPSLGIQEMRSVHYKQLNDQMFLVRGNIHPRRITRRTSGLWAIDNVPFQFPPTLDPEDNGVTIKLTLNAPIYNPATSYVIGDLVQFAGDMYRAKAATTGVFAPASWDKATYLPSWNIGQSYVVANVVEYFGSNYICIANHTSSTANRPASGAGLGTQWQLITYTDYAVTASGALFQVADLATTWLLQPGSNNRYVQETIPGTNGTTTSATVFIQGSYLVRTAWSAGNAPNGVTLRLEESLDRLNFTPVKEWTVSIPTEGTISYTADAPQTGAWYRMVSVRTSGTNTGQMIIEPDTARLNVPFVFTGIPSSTLAVGRANLPASSLIPNEALGFFFPIYRKMAFSGDLGYPKAVAFHDSRLWFGGTATEPSRIWGSQIDDFYNFLIGTDSTSALDVTLSATEANEILWMESYNRALVIGTKSEEWSLDSGEADGALTPASLRLRRRSRFGSLGLQPCLAADALLFLDKSAHLRELVYRFETDSYTGPDMSILADHLTALTPLQAAYSQSTDPILWEVTDKGYLLGFSYNRDQQVTAWHRHHTGDQDNFISVATVYSSLGSGDDVYFVVQRFNGDGTQSKYLLEKFNSNAMKWLSGKSDEDLQITPDGPFGNESVGFFSDCHTLQNGIAFPGQVTYDASYLGYARNYVLGVPYTNNDGSPVESLSNNTLVSFEFEGEFSTYCYVGLPFIAVCKPNRTELMLQNGTSQTRPWRPSQLSMRLWRSNFGNFCQRIDQLNFTNATRIETERIDAYPTYGDRGQTLVDVPWGQTKLQTMHFDWGSALDLIIAHKHPQPFNLLSIMMTVEVDQGTTSA